MIRKQIRWNAEFSTGGCRLIYANGYWNLTQLELIKTWSSRYPRKMTRINIFCEENSHRFCVWYSSLYWLLVLEISTNLRYAIFIAYFSHHCCHRSPRPLPRTQVTRGSMQFVRFFSFSNKLSYCWEICEKKKKKVSHLTLKENFFFSFSYVYACTSICAPLT